MIRVALRGLAGRKLRATLTAFAIILGVAMVSGTYVLTDTIDKAFDNIFSETYANTDAVVSGKDADINVEGESADTPPSIPRRCSKRSGPCRTWRRHRVRRRRYEHEDPDEGRQGREHGRRAVLRLRHRPGAAQFNPLKLLEGHWPSTPDEVVLDARHRRRAGLQGRGQRPIATRPARPREFEITGLAQYGDVASLGSATFAVFTIPTAQALLGSRGTVRRPSRSRQGGRQPSRSSPRSSRSCPPTRWRGPASSRRRRT